MTDSDKVFAGSIPALYERYLVPMIFAPYAADLVRRLIASRPKRILEIAAGTGVVTRAMADALPDAEIVATDLNAAMLEQAQATGTSRAVEWQQADAMNLPFDASTFDAVVCQFGAMFFPDKPHAFAEVRRVLKPGGMFLFNTWDRVEENDFAVAIGVALARVVPGDPPRFMARTPHGYHDVATIRRDLAAAGFAQPAQIETLAFRSRAESARIVAVAYCQGTPWRNEIEARDASMLDAATDAAEAEIAKRFGNGVVDGAIRAHVVEVEA
jgi:ubiquinone/menaquinone biosynthesis C-methylase UbiE